jgi:hypothetical protein
MDGRPTGTPPPDSLRAAWSGHLRDQRRVVLNLRHLTLLQTPKTGQNDTILGVLFVQMHKMSVGLTQLQICQRQCVLRTVA